MLNTCVLSLHIKFVCGKGLTQQAWDCYGASKQQNLGKQMDEGRKIQRPKEE